MDLQEALTNYETSMAALFEMTDDVLNAWTLIGSIGGTNWDADLEMIEENGIWTSAEAYEIAEGVEFKVRQGKSWDNNFGFNGVAGGDNCSMANLGIEAGTYYIVFDSNTGIISVVAA
jgi:hypothetical protein